MRNLLFILVLMAALTTANAQILYPAVVNSTGGSDAQSGITYEWSVGEIALVETMIAGNVIITNGLLQPEGIFTNSNVMTLVASNLLTPNGDGSNDFWIIKDIQLYPENTVTVIDRAGRVVYSKHGYINDWGGTLGAAPLNEGTYYYLLDFGTGSPKQKGFITILNDKQR